MQTQSLLLMSAGTLFFLVTMGYMNVVLKARHGFTYYEHPYRFIRFFAIAILCLGGVMESFINEYFTLQAFMLIAGSGIVYVSFSSLWQTRCPPGDYREHFGVPKHHEDMLQMGVGYGVVKTFEIVFQQLCALVVIEGLFLLESSAFVVSLMFATIVGLAHLPGVRYFGRMFGWFFTISSVVLALVYPLLIVSDYGGVGVMVLLHVLTYVLWYSYLFGRLPVVAYEKARE